MVSTYWVVLFLAGMYAVLSYPLDEELLYDDGYLFYPEEIDIIPNYPVRSNPDFIVKRAHTTQKRGSLNQLLQKLAAMYGKNEIQYSGRPSHVRFALGGRKR